MMSNWLQTDDVVNGDVRAVRTWSLILRDAQSIVVDRDGVDRDAQTVRITYDNDAKWVGGDSNVGKSSNREVVIFGIKDHPNSSVTDTDLQAGDRFIFEDVRYEIRDVFDLPGSVQCKAQKREG